MIYNDLGYNNFLTINSLQTGLEDGITNVNVDALVESGAIGLDQTTLSKLQKNENIQSSNFVSGISGWQINGEGDVEFNSGTFRGSLIAGEIHIPDKTSTSSLHVDSTGLLWSGSNVTNKSTAPVRLVPDGEMTLGNPNNVHLQLSGPNLRIQTSNFDSGVLGKGWRIDTNAAEFQNIIARGKITTSTFEKDTVSAMGGHLVIADADVLSADMTALDTSTLTTTNVVFDDNTIIRIKDGTNDEWLKVVSSSGYVHTVTRDLGNTYTADNNPTWQKGTAVVSMGAVDKGIIEMDVSSTNSPFIKVKQRDSLTYNDLDTKVIIGNLKDKTGVDEYGLWIKSGAAYIAGYRLFGAVVDAGGDGDYTNIQDAIDAGYTSIFVRSGTYTITDTIEIHTSNFNLVGESRENTTIKLDNEINKALIEIGNGTNSYENISIKNLELDGNGSNQTSGNGYVDCINVRKNITNLTIDNCIIHSAFNRGVSFKRHTSGDSTVTDGYITNNLIYNNGYNLNSNGEGIYLDKADNVHIYNNKIYENQDGNGIEINEYCSNIFVNNNVLQANDSAGIAANTNTIITNNFIIENNGKGIFINSDYSIINNNYLKDNNQDSSSTTKTELYAGGDHLVVNSNLIYLTSNSKSEYGIYIDATYINVVSNNLQKYGANSIVGIYVSSNTFDNEILGNVIHGFDTCIAVEGGAGSNDIDHNIMGCNNNIHYSASASPSVSPSHSLSPSISSSISPSISPSL